MRESVSEREIVDTAKGLVEPGSTNPEYVRGVCELVGRVRLDALGKGEGTAENAVAFARELGVDPTQLYGLDRQVLSARHADPLSDLAARRVVDALMAEGRIDASHLQHAVQKAIFQAMTTGKREG